MNDYYDRYESFRSDGNISIVPFIEIDVSATDINITFNKSTMRMDTLSFPADKELVKKAVAANEKANPDIHTFTGRVASGDQFISDKEVKERIVSLFHPMCVEMEGAGIAQAAYLNKVSYVIIRAISDKADNSATMDYPTFEKKAIAHSVRLMKELLPMI